MLSCGVDTCTDAKYVDKFWEQRACILCIVQELFPSTELTDWRRNKKENEAQEQVTAVVPETTLTPDSRRSNPLKGRREFVRFILTNSSASIVPTVAIKTWRQRLTYTITMERKARTTIVTQEGTNPKRRPKSLLVTTQPTEFTSDSFVEIQQTIFPTQSIHSCS